MSETHVYLPIEDPEVDNRIGFVRTAIADLTPAEAVYIEDMKQSKTALLTFPKDRDERFHTAYNKLKEARFAGNHQDPSDGHAQSTCVL